MRSTAQLYSMQYVCNFYFKYRGSSTKTLLENSQSIAPMNYVNFIIEYCGIYQQTETTEKNLNVIGNENKLLNMQQMWFILNQTIDHTRKINLNISDQNREAWFHEFYFRA